MNNVSLQDGKSSSDQFIMPLHFKDMILSRSDRFYVEDLLSLKDVSNSLPDAVKSIEKNAKNVSDREEFSVYYSAVYSWKKMNNNVRDTVMKTLIGNLTNLVRSKVPSSSNSIKMCCLLLTEGIKQSLSDPSSDSISRNPKDKKNSMKMSMRFPHQGISQLKSFFDSESIDEDLLQLLFRFATSILDRSIALKQKDMIEDLKIFVVDILVKSREPLEFSNYVVQALLTCEDETAAVQYVDLFNLLSSKESNQIMSLLSQVFSEIGKIQSSDLGKDSSGSKAVANFLSKISEHHSDSVLSNLSVLIPLLEEDNYILRNGVLTLVGNIILSLHIRDQDKTDEIASPPETRNSLFQVIGERIYDSNSYTRSKSLQVWILLCENKALPLESWSAAVILAVDRFADKSMNVRKNAIRLLTVLVQFNPFGPYLSTDRIQPQLEQFQPSQRDVICKSFADFNEQIKNGIDKALLQMYSSSTIAQETISLIQTCCLFEVEGSANALKEMLQLAKGYSDNEDVQKSLVKAFLDIFLLQQQPKGLLSFLGFIRELHPSQLWSLQSIVKTLAKDKAIPKGIVGILWKVLENDFDARIQTAAVQFLGMLSNANPLFLEEHLETLVSALEVTDDLKFMGETFKALQSITKRFPDHFNSLKPRILARVEAITSKSGLEWFAAAQQAVDVLFDLADDPEVLAVELLHKQSNALSSLPSQDLLAQLLFFAGHIALKSTICLQDKESQLHRLRKQKKSEETTGMEEYEAERAKDQAEYALMHPDSLLGKYYSIVQKVVLNPAQFSSQVLQSSAVLALSKFMLCSLQCCDENLQILFTLLEKSQFESVKTNIITSLVDLAFRFPNLIDPWSKYLFGVLEDKSSVVRQCTLAALSHLILNDMLKIKNDFSMLAKGICDNDRKVRELCRTLFQELSKKSHNPIYNLLPSTLNGLVRDPMPESDFVSIVEFLMGFVNNERQNEMLVEKIAQRFPGLSEIELHRRFFKCMSMLDFSKEKSCKKLIGTWKFWKHLLVDEQCYSSFQLILVKFEKSNLEEPMKELNELVADLFNASGKKQPETPKPSKKPKKTVHKRRKPKAVESEDEYSD